MRSRVFALLLLCAAMIWPAPARSQQQQPIRYFGYAGPDNDIDLARVKSYTNFSYIGGVYGAPITAQVTAIRNSGMRAVIDLGAVLWCQDDPANPYGGWHLCSSLYGEISAAQRWDTWTAMNASVLNSSAVLAFSVITEQTLRGIPVQDVQMATSLVKQRYPDIPTMVIDWADSISMAGSTYQVPNNVDWVGLFKYYIHPTSNLLFSDAVRILKARKQSWQRMAYTLDGFYKAEHQYVAPTAGDMDLIAQEWYSVASQDPEAILLGVFLWPDIPEEQAIGSANLPSAVLNKHAAIGSAILAGRVPTYQGAHEYIDCRLTSGWAWDASLPNSPIAVDIYDGSARLGTVRADSYRQDLAGAGYGNGYHGFWFPLSVAVRDGRTHVISVKYAGTDTLIGGSPRSITCAT